MKESSPEAHNPEVSVSLILQPENQYNQYNPKINMAAGPTWASSLQILVLLFGTAVLIHESIGGDVLWPYQATSVSCLSDHDLVYGVLKQKINHNKPKVITFRSYKNFDPEHYKQLLSSAPWHVGQLFDDVNDQAYLWNALMNNILDEVAPVKKNACARERRALHDESMEKCDQS